MKAVIRSLTHALHRLYRGFCYHTLNKDITDPSIYGNYDRIHRVLENHCQVKIHFLYRIKLAGYCYCSLWCLRRRRAVVIAVPAVDAAVSVVEAVVPAVCRL